MKPLIFAGVVVFIAIGCWIYDDLRYRPFQSKNEQMRKMLQSLEGVDPEHWIL